ncbi:MAG: (2Fe-2S)-binding protein [bacterium]|nr:(2Fe-2S)-binding protein [bacterium]
MSEPLDSGTPRDTLSRRSFLKGAGTVAAAGGVLGHPAHGEAPAAPDQDGPETIEGTVEVELNINGETVQVEVEPRTTLLSALRHRLQPPLTGSKEVCDRGDCGACTVSIDGKPAYSCLQLAVDLKGKEIRTIEGLGTPERMSPVQDAFCEHDASMCGFCTPGFVMATTVCLEKHPDADLDKIKHEISGNLCRCGTYPHIFTAALDARDRMREDR